MTQRPPRRLQPSSWWSRGSGSGGGSSFTTVPASRAAVPPVSAACVSVERAVAVGDGLVVVADVAVAWVRAEAGASAAPPGSRKGLAGGSGSAGAGVGAAVAVGRAVAVTAVASTLPAGPGSAVGVVVVL